MTVQEAAAYLAFALSAGAVFKAFYGPQLDIVRLQEQVKALKDRLDKYDHAGQRGENSGE